MACCSLLSCTCCTTHHWMRYWVSFLMFMCIVTNYGNRTALHFTILKMSRPHKKEAHTGEDYCPFKNQTVFTEEETKAAYDWTHQQNEIVLGAFYIGYLIMHLPSGVLCDKFGSRWVIGTGLLCSLVCTLTTPIVSDWGWLPLSFLRVLLGMAQGPLYPGITQLMSRWVPRNERSCISSFVYAGSNVGAVVGNIVTGYLVSFIGWRNTFYFWGGCTVVYIVLYFVYVYSHPEDSPLINEEELEYLQEVMDKHMQYPIPWRGILSDRAVWAITIGQLGFDFSQYTLQTNLPTYMDKVLHEKITANSVKCSLPFIFMFVSCQICGALTDWVVKKDKFKLINVRRFNFSISMIVPSIFIVVAGYVGCDGNVVTAMLILCTIGKGPVYAGQKVNVLDISKHFTGTIGAISNGLGALMGTAQAQVVSLIAPDHTVNQWRIVFWVTAGIGILSNIGFVCLCSASRRDFDFMEDEERTEGVA